MSLAISERSKPCDRPKSPAAPSLLVFSDDWGRHPSSCQHLIARLLPKYEVSWVNTIGMRPPRLDRSSLRRAAEKLCQWVGRSSGKQEEVQDRPRVLNPRMWPWFARPHDRKLNGWLLRQQLNRLLGSEKQPVVGITTIPIVADVMGQLPVDRWVYYCVDDFSQWPGLDQRAMATMEAEVIRRADICIAASEVLQQRLQTFREDVHLLTHGVDLSHWIESKNGCSAYRRPDDRRLATFWGLVDRRLDVDFLRAVAGRLDGCIALVGPRDNPPEELKRIPNIRLLPPVPYAQLPAIAAASDVLIMPYADLPVTRAMQPLKLLEYLATGKPVVARDLPSTRAWGDCLDEADTPEQFTELVVQRARCGLPEHQRRARARLAEEDWSFKAQRFERLVGADNAAG